MGLYDSFYDEDSKCPKCKSKITTDWQTKRLESMLESWHKGDFVQYRKLETIPERKRKRKYGDLKFASSLRHSIEFLSDAPLLLNGKVPVHTYCKKCESRLEAYARVVSGAFTGIVEIEADGKEKEFVRIRPDATARSLRQDFEDNLSHLQESCEHKKTKWMYMEWVLGPIFGQRRVCLKCEKTLETEEFEPDNPKLKNLLKRSRRLR